MCRCAHCACSTIRWWYFRSTSQRCDGASECFSFFVAPQHCEWKCSFKNEVHFMGKSSKLKINCIVRSLHLYTTVVVLSETIVYCGRKSSIAMFANKKKINKYAMFELFWAKFHIVVNLKPTILVSVNFEWKLESSSMNFNLNFDDCFPREKPIKTKESSILRCILPL